jgi:predicted signal transduction protein with EAL and GGDEF domain/sensor domain CHASE-containing protein
MILRKKTLFICLMLVGLLGVLYGFSRIFLLRSFAKLEDQDIRQNLDRAMSALSDDLSNLDSTVSEYSSWDRTYSFVEHPNLDFVKSELVFANNLRVNVVAIIDSSDRIVFAKAIDFATGKDVPFPQSLRDNLVPNAPLLRHGNTKSKNLGTILLLEGPLLLVSRPILTTTDEGPIRGTFIMGRWLDATEIRHLAEISHLSITVSRLDDPGMPSDWPMLHADASEESQTVVRVLNSQHTAGYRVLRDLYGKPALILRVDMPRRIYQQGQASLLHFTLVFLSSGLVFGAMILFLLETLERSQEERITERKRTERLLIGEKHLLEMITKGDSLANVLAVLARTVEEQSTGIFCSVMLLEPDGKTLRLVTAPSLPETFNRAIDNLTIGPSVCSCGAAAYTGKPIIVSDIARDTSWASYRELALSHGLSACWSVPIISTNGKVLGTIAVYCREPRGPSALELDVIERAADLVSIATERKQVEQKLVHNALHDSLTNMPNRVLFLDRLHREFKRSKHDPNHKFAVLFVDIDGFKKVNDSLGHSIGDQLISEIGRRLMKSLRGYDTISRPIASEGPERPDGENTLARLGGDEFTVLLVDINDPSDAIRAAKRIQTALAMPYTLGGQEVFVSASVGIALSTTPHSTPEDLLRDADIAMYRAKSLGKARYEIFDTAMHVQAVNRLNLETDLQRAVEREEFRLFYQPIISLHGGRITGFEALLRWQPPNRGLVGPAEFIGVAEETGLILPIGKWVLHQACQQARLWQTQYPSDPPLTISVNISGKQFANSDLAEEIRLVLEQTGIPPASLELEITETVAMGDAEKTIKTLSRLKALGVRLAIDDFGTGYSSLNYLRRLPFDTLKIDRSFVFNIGAENDSHDMVAIIVMLARNLGLRVVAEGLETAQHVNHLQKLNCEFGQGYFFSKPTDEETMDKLLLGSRHSEGNFVRSALVNSQL